MRNKKETTKLSCGRIHRIICVFLIFIFFGISALYAQETVLPPLELKPDQESPGSVRVLVISHIETTLSSEIEGRVEKLFVDMGSLFKKGDLLVQFNCDTYQAALLKAKAELKEAEKTLEVNRKLEAFNSVSALEVAVTEAKMEKAQADVLYHRATVERCNLEAPFDGRVVRRVVNPFEFVSAAQPLLEVVDHIRLELQLHVPSMWLKWIRQGMRFTVRIDETPKNYTARITVIGTRVDPASQTIEIRGIIEGQHPEMLPGMSGTAQFRF